MLDLTTISPKGQVTIPLQARKKLGLATGQKVRFAFDAQNPKRLTLEPVVNLLELKGSFKSTKTYSKALVREVYIKDVVAGKI